MFLIGKQSKLYRLCATWIVVLLLAVELSKGGSLLERWYFIIPSLPQLSYILSGPRQMIFVKLDDAYQRCEAQICISITQNLKNPPTA